MPKYEYKIIHPGVLRKQNPNATVQDLEDFINSFGAQGWKYKSPIVHGNDTHFMFEREVVAK